MRHILRSPDTIITVAITPIAMMLMFVYVFGGAIKTSLGDNVNYVNYQLWAHVRPKLCRESSARLLRISP
jgi:hypothetical protein